MLRVVTHTRHNRPLWLAECVASVAEQLPAGAVHDVIPCHGDFQAARFEAARSADFVAWVDDDDRVVGNSLARCVEALERTGASVAFTFEQRIDERGNQIGTVDRSQRSLRDVAMHPRMLHHLAVVRGPCLAYEVLEIAQGIGIGIDWLMRAWAALKHGAVQVPMIGYEWRVHPGGTSQSPSWSVDYMEAMPQLRAVLKTWMRHDAPIQRFEA